MIIKFFELQKVDTKNNNLFLFYGENEGLKDQVIWDNFKKKFKDNTYLYDEENILKNKNSFFDEILSQSFFDNEKLIIINRCSDKIYEIAKELLEKNIGDIIIIFKSNKLEKKSKLRNYFEKTKEAVCCPFYPDDYKSLSFLTNSFFKKKNIPISQEIINTIIERCNGDRQNLTNELEKIDSYMLNKKKITLDEILILTNLTENSSASELVDVCLAKNEKKMIRSLNENNFSNEETIIIIRTFLLKIKRLLIIKERLKNDNNIDKVIDLYKPPIFWKDKDLVKKQIKNYSQENLENLIFSLREIELIIKKNFNNSINILLDFIFQETKSISN